MNFALKSPQYENCEILSPDGQLMFRCCRKKANWYLKKNLGVKLAESPLTVQLTFIPKGVGHLDDPYFLQIMENRCVVCGGEEDLNRHHIVPYCYRRFFPIQFKEHRSYDVMPLCIPCHRTYEDHAVELKKKFADKYNAPLSGAGFKFDKMLGTVKGAASTLLSAKDKLPPYRFEALSKIVEDHLHRKWTVEDLENLSKVDPYNFGDYVHHGKIVLDKLEDINEFVQIWRCHFLETMKPQFLPKYWTFERVLW